MGHIAQPRKQFKSINTYDCIITLIRRRKKHYRLFENWMVPYLNKLASPSPKGTLCQVWLKLALWRRRFLNVVNVFSVLSNYLPLVKVIAFRVNKPESPFTQRCSVPASFVEIGPVVLKKILYIFHKCIFAISLLSLLEKGRGPSFEKFWVPFTQGCLVPSLVEIRPVVLEKKILYFIKVFSLIRYCLPLKRSVALQLNNLEFSSPKDALYQVWLKLAQWFRRRRF